MGCGCGCGEECKCSVCGMKFESEEIDRSRWKEMDEWLRKLEHGKTEKWKETLEVH